MATGDIHVAVRNRVVLTNKTPTGLNRGFGGPQMYYALERLMQRVAIELKLDPIDVIRRNLVPAKAFPYRTATGALLDSGDYSHALDVALHDGEFAELKERRDVARAQGRIYGIGCTAVVEPSVSNMGYITTVLTAEERRRAGAKNGAQATATVAFDPLGTVSVQTASAPQGQGHRTVLAQIVADVFGLVPNDIHTVSEIDTARDAWSIASGNYSSRFAAAVGGAAHLAATRLKEKLARTAAAKLNVSPVEVEFAGGRVCARGNPDNSIPFARLAATSHWSPGMIISGGENISPVEIESCLSLHPAVSEVAVVGLPDERWGKVIAAFVKRRSDVQEAELDNFCQTSGLAKFKRPRRYLFVRDIPKSPVGKLLRRKLVAGEYEPESRPASLPYNGTTA